TLQLYVALRSLHIILLLVLEQTVLQPLSLHDALPISLASARAIPTLCFCPPLKLEAKISDLSLNPTRSSSSSIRFGTCFLSKNRSEEHTSELQSRFDLVCRLLLEKKNKE